MRSLFIIPQNPLQMQPPPIPPRHHLLNDDAPSTSTAARARWNHALGQQQRLQSPPIKGNSRPKGLKPANILQLFVKPPPTINLDDSSFESRSPTPVKKGEAAQNAVAAVGGARYVVRGSDAKRFWLFMEQNPWMLDEKDLLEHLGNQNSVPALSICKSAGLALAHYENRGDAMSAHSSLEKKKTGIFAYIDDNTEGWWFWQKFEEEKKCVKQAEDRKKWVQDAKQKYDAQRKEQEREKRIQEALVKEIYEARLAQEKKFSDLE